MASAKSLIVAGVLAMPCVDAFVVPVLRVSPLVVALHLCQLNLSQSLVHTLLLQSAAVLSAGTKKHVARKHVACDFSKELDSLILPALRPQDLTLQHAYRR